MQSHFRSSRVPGAFWGCVFMLGLLCFLSGFQPSGSQASAAQRGSVNLRVDVELITVEVSVIDKKGNPIHNLSREDFQLFEDGKQQDVVTFAEVKEDPVQETPTSLADIDESGPNRGKVVLIFFDDSHLTPGQLQIARESAENFVKGHMRPLDLFAVASYGMSLRILQNFTHDVGKVVEAIRQPSTSYAPASHPLGRSADADIASTPGMPRNTMGTSTDLHESRFRASALFRALNSLTSSVAQVKGRKTVLFFSEDFSSGMDVESEFTGTVESAKRANVAFYTIDTRGLMAPQIISQLPNSHRDDVSGDSAGSPAAYVLGRPAAMAPFGSSLTTGFMATSMFQQGGGQGGGQGGSRGGGGQPPGGSSGGTPNPGTGSGGRAATPTNPSPSTTNTTTSRGNDISQTNRQDLARFAKVRLENMLRSLAIETGGLAIFNTGDFNARLNEVSLELSNYYVLGFQSNNPKRDGKFRKLEVKVIPKGVQIRHRQGYVDPRPVDILAGSKGERSLVAAMAAPAAAAQLPVAFRAVYFYESPGLARVPVMAGIRASNVELKRKGDQLLGDLNIMGIAYSESGAIVARFSETLHLTVPKKEEEQKFRNERLVYWNHFKLRPGKYQVKVAVSDEKGKVGSAEQALEVPPMPQQELAASSLVVADKITRQPDLIQDMQTKLLDDSDPILYRGFQILPSIENHVAVASPVGAVFKMYNLSGDTPMRQLVARVQLKGENGETRALEPIPLDENLFQTGKTEGVIGLKLPFSNVTAGKYKLVIAASEGVSKRTVTMETDLVFK